MRPSTASAPTLPCSPPQSGVRSRPSAARRARQEKIDAGEDGSHVDAWRVGQLHLRDTITAILHSSEMISDAVASGRLGIVGANYKLAEGTAVPDVMLGIADESASDAKEGSIK